jgi:hypothetical protein
MGMNEKKGVPGPVSGTPEGTDDQAQQAEQRFIDDLIARGEAVPEGEELPPGATHVIVYDDDGRRTVRRKRFSSH